MSLRRLDLPRAERAAEAARLRATGLNGLQIAARMGLGRSYVSALLNDPTGEKDRARKRSYGRPCLDCGDLTDGSNGRANAPDYCFACYNRRRELEHGTLSKYRTGCSCDSCREANRLYQRSLVGQPPKTHGYSGYINYGCRCDVCRRAHSDYLWLHPEYRERYREKIRGTEPRRHGTRSAYEQHGCRCDVCRDWCRDNARRRRALKREKAVSLAGNTPPNSVGLTMPDSETDGCFRRK